METARIAQLLLITCALSSAAVAVLARVAPALGIVDTPGGRKEHAQPVPLVGGLAIFIALFAGAWIFGIAQQTAFFLLALSIIIAVGFWDDVTDLSPRVRLAIQIGASAIMIWGAGIHLSSLGDLLGWRPIGLSALAIPLTIFAVVGVANAINMMDGVDGLAGCMSLAALVWFVLVAAQSGLQMQSLAAIALCGGLAGFLVFNLRLPWQRHARAFLGDAGSLMLGFALAWNAIDLTQGPGRTFPPIAALWIVLLPLGDCVSLIMRRVGEGRSPFSGDRRHIHHYLLARGFTHTQTLAILIGVSVVFGAVGYFGWLLRAPEPALFYPFFAGFFAYHAWITREWRKLDLRAPQPVTLAAEDAAARAS